MDWQTERRIATVVTLVTSLVLFGIAAVLIISNLS